MGKKDIRFDRVVAEELVHSLRPGEAMRPLIDFRNERQDIFDVQFRRPSGRISRASLYAGLTRPLDVDARIIGSKKPEFRFFVAHRTHRDVAIRFGYERWSWQPLEELAARWSEVSQYLAEREKWFQEESAAAHHVIEGRVHAAMCRDTVTEYRAINREASPSFRDEATKARICGRIRDEMRRVLDAVPKKDRWLRYREFGTSPDILAVDDSGRLIVAEAKPFSYTSGISKGPIQVRYYAGLLSRWLELDPEAPVNLHRMLEQRIEAGLTSGPLVAFDPQVSVVPVLAIGVGVASSVAVEHAIALRDALAQLDPAEAGKTAPTEIWRLGTDGNVNERI
ncbi:MAG: hypothetical protein WEE66_07970 [Actinomycetota bacterium]